MAQVHALQQTMQSAYYSLWCAYTSFTDFKGFAVDGVMVAEDIEPEIRPVDVIQVAGGNLQWVALQCEIVEGSTPTPAIQWRKRPVGSDPETVPGDLLVEDFISNTIRFVDGGEWLILETDELAITGLEYFCEVTNKWRFQTVRGPLTYTLNPGGPFSLLHVTHIPDLFWPFF